MRKQKTYFFTGVDGPTGHLFRTGNKPKRADYETLMDSVPFILDPADSAKENEAGHTRIETDSRAIGRSLPAADGFSRAVLAHQLPVIKGTLDVGDVVVSTTTVSGITIKEVTRTDGTRIRRDYIITSGLSLTSPLGSIVITPVANGFELEVNPAITDTYKVMGDAGDGVPGYLSAKVGSGLTVDGTHRIVPVIDPAATNVALSVGILGFSAQLNYAGTNTIQLLNPGGVLTPNVRYNGTWFTEDAGTGLRLLPHGITQNEIALGTILGTNINANPGFFFGDGINHDGTRMYARVHKSLQLDPTGGANIKPIELVGDVAAPGNTKHYGTDALGVKGWHDTPDGSKWLNGYDNTAVYAKNSGSNALAPYSVALGKVSTPWIPTSIGYSTIESSETLQFVMRIATPSVGGFAALQVQGAPYFIDIPNDSMFTIEGKVIAYTSGVGNMNVFKFFAVGKKLASILTIGSILYDTQIAPFHVIQAGVAPYATAYVAEAANIDIQIIESDGYIKIEATDSSAGANGITYWTEDVKLHVNGGSILNALYTP
jgi:hypothetical protein